MRKSSILLLLQYGKVQAGSLYKMASEMGLEPLQISICYKMAGLLKVISYKMTLEIGRLKKGHFIGVKKTGIKK